MLLVLLVLLGACGASSGAAGRDLAIPAPSAPPSADATLTPAPTRTLNPDAQVRPDELRIVEDLLEFARSGRPGDARRLPFADHVALGLGSQLEGQLASTDAHRPAAWRLNVDYYFAGHVGPFSALTTLRATPTDNFTVTTGSHPRCAGGPPIAALATYAEHRHIAVQPRDIESCLDWFSVDLFLDRHGRISAVTLDLWDP